MLALSKENQRALANTRNLSAPELLVKVAALGLLPYLSSRWHQLDAFVVAASLLSVSAGASPAFRALPPQPAAPPLALGRARRSSAAQTDAAIAASARGDALTTTLGYVQRRAALRDITNHI